MAEGAALLQARIEREREEDQHDIEEAGYDDVLVEYYPSNVLENSIVNAASGVSYPFQVGSLESLKLFHVVDATGTVNSMGIKEGYNCEPNHLYYDSPQQYMRHRGGRNGVSSKDILNWERKVSQLFPNSNDTKPNLDAFADMRMDYRANLVEQRNSALERESKYQAEVLREEARNAARAEWMSQLAETTAINRRRGRNEEIEARRTRIAASRREKRFRQRERQRAKKREQTVAR